MARLSGLTARGGLAARCTNKGRAPCISPADAPLPREWAAHL